MIIAHSQGLSTWYAHMQSRYKVRAGQRVSQGQVIGYEGNTGHSTGAHLHWMVEFNGNFVNPTVHVAVAALRGPSRSAFTGTVLASPQVGRMRGDDAWSSR